MHAVELKLTIEADCSRFGPHITVSLLLAASIAITFVAGANIYIGTEYDGDECMGHETELWYDVDQS